MEVHCRLEGCETAELFILSERVSYNSREGMLYSGSVQAPCPADITGLSVIVDGEIIEIADDSGIMNVIMEREAGGMEGEISMTCDGWFDIHIYEG